MQSPSFKSMGVKAQVSFAGKEREVTNLRDLFLSACVFSLLYHSQMQSESAHFLLPKM